MIWALLIVGLVNSILGFVVYRRTKPSRERSVFMALMIALALWAWGIAFFLVSTEIWRAQLFVTLYYVAAIFIAALVLAFSVAETTSKRPIWSWLIYVPVAVWIAFLLVQPTWFVHVVQVSGELSSRVTIDSVLYLWYGILFCIYYAAALVVLYRDALRSRDIVRRRKLLIAHGFVVAGLGGMVFNLFLPWLGLYDFIAIGPLFSTLFAICVTYSIVKYSLFDLRQSFLLSLSYIVTFGTLIVVQGIVVWLANLILFGGQSDLQTVSLMNAIVIVIAAAIFQPIKRFFDQVTEKIFFHYDYDTQAVLEQVGEAAARQIELQPFVTQVLRTLGQSLQVEYVKLYLFDEHAAVTHRFSFGKAMPDDALLECCNPKLFAHGEHVAVTERFDSMSSTYRKLHDANVAALVHLSNANQSRGYIVMGNKLSGIAYSYKDVNLLTLLANEVSLAVENSLRYEEITQFNETLSTRVEDATAELRANNKKLKVMDQTKDEFISLTSHQLRTPLTTIKGYISMLLDGDAGELAPQQRKLLEEAFNSSQRMVHLISDFLNISRIQTGKFEIELSEVNLADILNEEIDQLRISATSRQLRLDYDKPEHFPILPVDEGKIRQVMMNFIDNAIYYSPSGSSIRIILAATTDAVEFKVVDHGIGVPKAEQHKLFTKFSRASNAKKQRPDGTGIGLFMAKKVIVALGGSILFESKEGVGSTFGFRLNRASSSSGTISKIQ